MHRFLAEGDPMEPPWELLQLPPCSGKSPLRNRIAACGLAPEGAAREGWWQMDFPWYLLVPLLAAGAYAAASLCFKQAYAHGLGMMEAFYWLNFAGMLMFAPLWFQVGSWPAVGEWWKPALTAGMIFCGTWTTFAAIRAGDVSLVTPLMGTKVVITALVASGLAGTRLPAGLWVAALLTSVGILVLGGPELRRGQGRGWAIGLCLLSSSIFAGADVLIGHWAAGFGRALFLASMFTGIGLISLATVRWQAPGVFRLPRAAQRFTGLGVGIMTAQTGAMGLCIAASNDPTGVNVIYGTRGLWSIGLIWFVGRRWFGNTERSTAGGAMAQRLAGALLILTAVIVAVASRR